MNASTNDATVKSTPTHVPVLIVGGGAAGLTSSMLLSQLGVDHLLVNARPETSAIPKAHSLNQRTMEILEDLGIADQVAAEGTPPENLLAAAFYAGFAGPDPDYGRRIARLEARGAGGADENWRAASPWLSQNLPQNLLEPILKARAIELAPQAVRFDHTLVALEQDDDGITSTIRANLTGEEYVVRSDYLLGADGGQTVAAQLGVTYEGLGVLTHTATLHVSADFSDYAHDPDVLIRWIISPQIGAGVVMVPVGPTRWGPDSEEWVIHLQYPADDNRPPSDEQVEADARTALGLPDHPMKIHKVTRWAVDAVVASQFTVGRTFLLGDAAHRHPPTGGLGLTSAIQDAHNLCWKIAAVHAGHASPALLDTYEPERRPAIDRNTQRSLENAFNHMTALAATGVSHEKTTEENLASLKRLFSGRPEDADVRRDVLRVIREGSMEFGALDIEHGTRYESDAVVPDGTQAPAPLDDIRVYEPSTRPGSPLPHAWIDDEDGERRPIKDLVEPGRFLLIAGEDGDQWCEAAAAIAAANQLPVDAVRIGHLDGDLYDPRCTWLRHRGIGRTGAILVRPDRFVAWRSHDASAAPQVDLATALSRVLARPIAPPAA